MKDQVIHTDGHATFYFIKDVGLGKDHFGMGVVDGGGFSTVLMHKDSWIKMRKKIDKLIRRKK